MKYKRKISENEIKNYKNFSHGLIRQISCFLNASVTLGSSAASHNSTLLKAHISTTPVISLNVSGGLVTFKVSHLNFFFVDFIKQIQTVLRV